MHDWVTLAGNVQWCTLCGCVRNPKASSIEIFFPYAYQKVSETTCAKARKQREAANAAGRNRLGRTSAELAAGEVRVGSRATPIPSAPAECDAGHEE